MNKIIENISVIMNIKLIKNNKQNKIVVHRRLFSKPSLTDFTAGIIQFLQK